MKKYRYLLAGLLAMSMASCDSLLNQTPYGSFTADQLDDQSVEGLLAAAYAGLNAHYFGG